MKRLTLFAAICLMFAATIKAQPQITPQQLKAARNQVYRWINHYIECSDLKDGNVSRRRFLSQFNSGNAQVVNDYLPTCDDEVILADSYYNLMTAEENLYRCKVSFGDVKIVKESIRENQYKVVLSVEKTISFADRKSEYVYPAKSYIEQITLSGAIDSEYHQLACEKITTQEKLHVDYVLHDPKSSLKNVYVDNISTVLKNRDLHSALITTRVESMDFDSKMLEVRWDTIKNKLCLQPFIGGSFIATSVSDKSYSDLSSSPTFTYGLQLIYYRQLLLKDKNRYGIQIGIGLSKSKIALSGSYQTSFNDVDPDGSVYQMNVKANDLTESINRVFIDIPLSFRYDRFISDNISVFCNAGINMKYDVIQSAVINANALYSGYYDWLFDVTIDQNGIYNFGKFDVATNPSKIAISKFGIGAFAGVGAQYIFPKSKCSLEVEIQYNNIFYNPLKRSVDKTLSTCIDDWKSVSNLLEYVNTNNLKFMIGFGWNF